MFNKLLVAVDGSDHANRALDVGVDLARTYGAKLHIISVYRHHSPLENTHSLVRGREEIETPDAALARFAKEVVTRASAHARATGAPEVEAVVKRGPPARTIVAFAKEQGADAIVMGSRGLGAIEGFLLGSVSHKVTSLAECTCITVH